jgi:hypothetical protein
VCKKARTNTSIGHSLEEDTDKNRYPSKERIKERLKPAPAVLCCRKYGAGFYYNKIAARQQRKHMSSL